VSEAIKTEQGTGSPALGISAAVAGWAVPGLGHLLLRQWVKAAVYFLCVGGLAWAGLAMRGGVFGGNPSDMFDRLGFLADLGTGGFISWRTRSRVRDPMSRTPRAIMGRA
jgi:hypothetical protein